MLALESRCIRPSSKSPLNTVGTAWLGALSIFVLSWWTSVPNGALLLPWLPGLAGRWAAPPPLALKYQPSWMPSQTSLLPPSCLWVGSRPYHGLVPLGLVSLTGLVW